MHAPLKLGALLLALASLTSIAAPADAGDRRDRGYDRDRHGYYDRDHRRDDRHDRRHDRRAYRHGYRDGYRHDRRDDRRVVYRYAPPPVYRSNHYYAPPRQAYYRGPPPWSRGVRYYDRGYPTYVVSNYHGYGLHRPPYGHGWRRDDHGNFILVALATGIIANVIFR